MDNVSTSQDGLISHSTAVSPLGVELYRAHICSFTYRTPVGVISAYELAGEIFLHLSNGLFCENAALTTCSLYVMCCPCCGWFLSSQLSVVVRLPSRQLRWPALIESSSTHLLVMAKNVEPGARTATRRHDQHLSTHTCRGSVTITPEIAVLAPVQYTTVKSEFLFAFVLGSCYRK